MKFSIKIIAFFVTDKRNRVSKSINAFNNILGIIRWLHTYWYINTEKIEEKFEYGSF